MIIRFFIDNYRFGAITINGKEYTSDLIITPDKIIPDWWRKESHYLSMEDLSDIDWTNLNSVIIGTGEPGKMRVAPSLVEHLEQNNIPFLIKRTSIAVKEFNRSIHNKKLGIFHLTC
jgi:hypothetical protein